jgi:hypothetical protein
MSEGKILRRQLKASNEFRAALVEAQDNHCDEWSLWDPSLRATLLNLVDLFVVSRNRESYDNFFHLSELSRTKTSGHPREEYYHGIIKLWIMLTGRLTFSRDSVTKKPGGPLVRYIRAVTKPVMGKDAPTPEGIAKLICRERDRRRRAKECKRSAALPMNADVR